MKLNINSMARSVLFVLAMLLCNFTFAQRTITGTVTDAETGEPLIGANILVVGSSTGTITDFDGTYSLNVSDDAKELEFSYTGYGSQRVEIGNQTTIDMSLSAGQELEEVVVVGYGTTTKKEVTSSVSSVKAEDFNKGNVNDPSQLLQGKVAGLTIARPGSDPNGDFNIRLRGLSNLGANQSPLVVIDGVIGASLNSIDPNDIASIDVLKDGSAAAIYGTRASAGVILITTKTGKKGTATVDYNGFVSAENVARTVQTTSADEFRRIPGAVDQGASTDWIDELTETGISQVHNLSLSGGSELTTYRVSGNFRDIGGVARGTGFQRINGNLSLTQKALSQRLTMTMNVTATTQDSDFGFSEAFRYGTIFNPTAPVLDPDNEALGGYFEPGGFDYFNPVSIIEQNINEGRQNTILASFRADYELTDGLTIGAFYSTQRIDRLRGEYYSKTALYRGNGRNGLAIRETNNDLNQLFESTLNYQRAFGKLELKGLLGYSYQEFTFEGFRAEGGNFITDLVTYNDLGASKDFNDGLGDLSSYRSNSKLIAGFARVNLNYDDTYFFSVAARQEGSSKFGEDNRWGLFPSVSAGVDISRLADLGAFDNLKLRAGYGVTGGLPRQDYESLIRLGQTGANFFFNGTYIPVYAPESNPNPNLAWESKTDINIGVDFALFDYKLTGSIDAFQSTTTDALISVPVAVPPNLVGETLQNIGELSTQGVELSLNAAVVSNESVSWETGVVLATSRSVLDQFTEDQSINYRGNPGAPGQNITPGSGMIKVEAGEPVGNIWGPVYEGLDDDGNYIFEDGNGDGTYCACNDDYAILGNAQPNLTLGWNNSLTFGNFDLNMFFRGVFGHDMVNLYRAFYESPTVADRYNVVQTEYYDPNLNEPSVYNSQHVEDASFLRLDNATLGYAIPIPDGGNIGSLRLYVTGQNLFTITDYSGVDPSLRLNDAGSVDNGGRPEFADNPDPLVLGIDRRNTYFTTTVITFGANVKF